MSMAAAKMVGVLLARVGGTLKWSLCLALLVCVLTTQVEGKRHRRGDDSQQQGLFALGVLLGTLLLATLLIMALAAGARAMGSSQPGKGKKGKPRPYKERQSILHADLVDPEIRGDHLAYNTYLHKTFEGRRFVKVEDESCHIAFTYSVCRDILNDHSSFSSNPYASDRLVALNTMGKVDHARVLRYVHSHYTPSAIESLQERLEAIVERCTDELELAAKHGSADVMRWAKRIHMASTLTRLGVDFNKGTNDSWSRVDELVKLNDAMVALVAPLGGVGLKFSDVSIGNVMDLLIGLVQSVGPLLTMLLTLGLRCTWAIVRPDVTLLWPPRAPRSGVWWHADLLPMVPAYFLGLYEMMLAADCVEGGPLEGIKAGVDAGGLSMAEALTLIAQLMVNMTSANALGSLVFRLAKEREAVETVRGDASQVDAFVNEVLRLDSPLQRNPRRVVALTKKWCDDELDVGDHILVFLGAANMDPAVFDSPDIFRLGREAKPLTFGSGIHYCLGTTLVKVEMRAALQCLLRRFNAIKISGCHRLVDVDVGNWGFKELLVEV